MAVHRSMGRSRRHGLLERRLVFEQLNPWVMFTYYVVTIACSMIFIHPVFLLIELGLVLAFDFLSGCHKQTWMALQGGLFMMAFIAVLNPLLNNHGAHVIWAFGGMLITVEAVVYGLLMAISLLIMLLIFVSYNKYLTGQKFMYLFSRVSPQITLLTLITLRFVPLLMRRFCGITQMQAIRGVDTEHGSLKQRAGGVMKLMEVLLVNSFNNALQTADSMTSRGYGSGRRTSYQRYQFTKRDIFTLCWYVPLSLFCFYAASQGLGRMPIYPTIGAPGVTGENLIVLVGVVILYGFPIFLEAWEWVWWNLLERSI